VFALNGVTVRLQRQVTFFSFQNTEEKQVNRPASAISAMTEEAPTTQKTNGSMTDEVATMCANCGKGEELKATLKTCNACKLVKYCGRDCQIAHRPQHKNACKKRATELHDEALFRQPPKAEDCPICFLLLPEALGGKMYMSCCGKILCSGCVFADFKQNQRGICPFCRAEVPGNAGLFQQLNKRLQVNDLHAFYNMWELGIFSVRV
jgi:hypothetical protein